MAMIAGDDVVIADDETVSAGTGMKRAIYDADAASLAPTLPAAPVLGSTAAPWRGEKPVSADDVASVKTARVKILREAARRANAYGEALVTYVQANATAKVGAAVGGLQKTPNPNDPNKATAAPGADVFLPIL